MNLKQERGNKHTEFPGVRALLHIFAYMSTSSQLILSFGPGDVVKSNLFLLIPKMYFEVMGAQKFKTVHTETHLASKVLT